MDPTKRFAFRGGPKIVRALAAAAVLAAPVVYSALATPRAPGLVAGVGIAGVALLLVGALAGASDAVAGGIALAGSAYLLLVLLGEGGVDLRAPLVAGALVLAAELAYSALEPPLAPASPAVRALRAARVALTVLGAGAAAGLVLFASVAELGSPAVLEAVGIAAAVAALGLLALLAWRLT
jgi:hypothetical protein